MKQKLSSKCVVERGKGALRLPCVRGHQGCHQRGAAGGVALDAVMPQDSVKKSKIKADATLFQAPSSPRVPGSVQLCKVSKGEGQFSAMGGCNTPPYWYCY